MPRTPEGAVKDDVKKWFKNRNIWYYMPVQNGMGVTGIPDFICCWNGKFVGVECKAPGKIDNLSENQKHQIEAIRRAGGKAIVIDHATQLEKLYAEI